MNRRTFLLTTASAVALGLVPGTVEGQYPSGSVVLMGSGDHPATASQVNAFIQRNLRPDGVVVLSGFHIDGDESLWVPAMASKFVLGDCTVVVRENVEGAIRVPEGEGPSLHMTNNLFRLPGGVAWV